MVYLTMDGFKKFLFGTKRAIGKLRNAGAKVEAVIGKANRIMEQIPIEKLQEIRQEGKNELDEKTNTIKNLAGPALNIAEVGADIAIDGTNAIQSTFKSINNFAEEKGWFVKPTMGELNPIKNYMTIDQQRDYKVPIALAKPRAVADGRNVVVKHADKVINMPKNTYVDAPGVANVSQDIGNNRDKRFVRRGAKK
jgi:hypothetical protein